MRDALPPAAHQVRIAEDLIRVGDGSFRAESDGGEKTQKLAAQLYTDVFKA
jgi:hypothetical protein